MDKKKKIFCLILWMKRAKILTMNKIILKPKAKHIEYKMILLHAQDISIIFNSFFVYP